MMTWPAMLNFSCTVIRETKSGWSLLTFETDGKGTFESSSWLIRWARLAGKIDFGPALAALVLLGRLSLCLSLYLFTNVGN